MGVHNCWRRATGQAKLQAELASQKGLFFKAVTQSMARQHCRQT